MQIGDVPGSGKDGRVLKEDILQYIEQSAKSARIPSTSKGISNSNFIPSHDALMPSEGNNISFKMHEKFGLGIG